MEFHFNRKKVQNKKVYTYAAVSISIIVAISIGIGMLLEKQENLTIPEPVNMGSTFVKRVPVTRVEFCDQYKNALYGNKFVCYRYQEQKKQWILYKQYN